MIKPIGKRVVIKKIPNEETTASGIIIAQQNKEKPLKAEVIAVGNEITEVKVGDTVLFKKYAGTEFKLGSQEIAIVDLEDILAVIE